MAEQAGDEAELWRYRVNSLVWRLMQALMRGAIDEAESRDAVATCQAAAEFFEQQQDWEFLDEALDIWAQFLGTRGAYVEAIVVNRRRLATPGISTRNRGKATASLTAIYFMLGDYDQCIATAHDAVTALHPGEPIEYFAEAVSMAMWAAYVSGRWDQAALLLRVIEQMWERLQLRPGAGRAVFEGYLAALFIATAREDRPAVDLAYSALERMFPDNAVYRDFLSAMRENDPGKLDIDKVEVGVAGLLISLYSEVGLLTPPKLMQISVFQNDMTTWCAGIAQALIDDDNAQLAQAIDEAEAHDLLVHAARMRVVLAQRNGDRTQLKRARPVLEQLEDRQFLKRLEEVEEAIS
jgi:hypothetical protein